MRAAAARLPRTAWLTRSLGLGTFLAFASFVLLARSAVAQTPTATPYPTRLELAPIESVEVQVLESQPPQYLVSVTSGLPGGCAAFANIAAARNATRIDVTVQNTMPAVSIPCTAIYGYRTTNLNLGSDFVAGTTYTVVVNGAAASSKTTMFTAQGVSQATPTATATTPAGGGATPTAPRPANTGTGGVDGGRSVEALDAVIGASAVGMALLAVTLIVTRNPRRR